MKLENKLKAALIVGSLIGAGLNLTSCVTHELCPAYKSYTNKNNIEIKNQNYASKSENHKFFQSIIFLEYN